MTSSLFAVTRETRLGADIFSTKAHLNDEMHCLAFRRTRRATNRFTASAGATAAFFVVCAATPRDRIKVNTIMGDNQINFICKAKPPPGTPQRPAADYPL